MKAYAINFNPLVVLTHDLLGYLDTRPEIKNWYTPFPGTVLIAAEDTPRALAVMIGKHFPTQQFLISETNYANSDGQMPNIAWNFINHPQSSGRWESAPGVLASSPLNRLLQG